MNGQLSGMGEKIFKNGNEYVGEFRNGIFEGNGVLKNKEKKNWVSGYFKDGNLVDLLEYSNDGATKNINKVIEVLHERKTNWINNEVQLPRMDLFIDEIEKIITTEPKRQVQTLEQRKMEVLKRIQDKFLEGEEEGRGDDLEYTIKELRNGSQPESLSFAGQPQSSRTVEGKYYQ